MVGDPDIGPGNASGLKQPSIDRDPPQPRQVKISPREPSRRTAFKPKSTSWTHRGLMALLFVLHPPIPGELVQMTALTDNNETNGHHVPSVPTARFSRTIRAVRVLGLLDPPTKSEIRERDDSLDIGANAETELPPASPPSLSTRRELTAAQLVVVGTLQLPSSFSRRGS